MRIGDDLDIHSVASVFPEVVRAAGGSVLSRGRHALRRAPSMVFWSVGARMETTWIASRM